jgi:hypothetical protein
LEGLGEDKDRALLVALAAAEKAKDDITKLMPPVDKGWAAT